MVKDLFKKEQLWDWDPGLIVTYPGLFPQYQNPLSVKQSLEKIHEQFINNY